VESNETICIMYYVLSLWGHYKNKKRSEYMFCAHINPTTLEEQSVKEHLCNVAAMAMEYGGKISLNATGELIGILHDMGKATNKFNSYIHYCSAHPNDKLLGGQSITPQQAQSLYMIIFIIQMINIKSLQHSLFH